MLRVRNDNSSSFPEQNVGDFLAIPGEVFRTVAGRRTSRVERNGRTFFVKCHVNIGWREIWKNLLTLRLPVIGARREWRALRRLESLGVAAPRWVAFGEEGWNPASRRSFLVTEELRDIRDLEHWAKEIKHHPDKPTALAAKWALIDKVGRLTRVLHENGINHRDFYLCHLHLRASREAFFKHPEALPVHVMDLHRAQMHRRTPVRWAAKDIQGLLYSCRHGPAALPLTSRDLIRFLRTYRDDWRASLFEERRLWRLVLRRFRRSHRRQFGYAPLRAPFRLPRHGPGSSTKAGALTKSALLRFPIPLPASVGKKGTLRCEEILRFLPGRRIACRGRWGEKAVFVKLFARGHREARHWRREKQALETLRTSGIAAPNLLHAGTTTRGEHILVTTYLQAVQTVEQVCQSAFDDSDRRSVLEQLVRLFALHHERGVLHQDPHLANFALAEDGTVTLDAGSIRLRSAAISRRPAVWNLGLLLAQFPHEVDEEAHDLFEAYARARDWERRADDHRRITQAVRKARGWRRRKYLSKIFRDCSAVVHRQDGSLRLLCYRNEYHGDMCDLLADPDTFLGGNRKYILKAGNSSTVTLVNVNGKALVVKRYNIRDWRHTLMRALQPTRAARSWYNAHALAFEGIATARPVACLEKRLGPFRRQSYLVTEFVRGPTCQRYFADQANGDPADHDAVAGVTTLLRRLEELNLEHGDMKASNIIMAARGPVLVDLDAMHRHRSARRFQRAARRDRQRFQLNWKDLPAVRALFEESLRQSM